MSEIIIKITNASGARLLTPSEAAERLGMTPHQVRWLIRNDRIDGVVQSGRSFFIPETSLGSIRYETMGRPTGMKDSKPRKPKTSKKAGVAKPAKKTSATRSGAAMSAPKSRKA